MVNSDIIGLFYKAEQFHFCFMAPQYVVTQDGQLKDKNMNVVWINS